MSGEAKQAAKWERNGWEEKSDSKFPRHESLGRREIEDNRRSAGVQRNGRVEDEDMVGRVGLESGIFLPWSVERELFGLVTECLAWAGGGGPC